MRARVDAAGTIPPRRLEFRLPPATLPVLVWLLMNLMNADPHAQLSPGPLARAHAEFEGARNCLRCHDVRGSMDVQCKACHGEIAWQVERGLGLHGDEKLAECASCHPDHGGGDFELISWEEGGPNSFDHDRTGWSLSGRHASTNCRDCHKTSFQIAPIVDLIKRADRSRSWLGLVRDCAGCHEDRHAGALGADCARCHTDRAWKPADRFDHAESDYPLTGKHADVACERCHLVPGRIFLSAADGSERPRYKALPYAECSDCHTDPHAGRLGAACGSCHVTDDFRRIDRERFDHARTRYPLHGKHRALDCAKCHDPQNAWGKKPQFERCDSCHRDAHAGSATIAGRTNDCASCHDDHGFAPSTLTVADHDRTDYLLEGRHREVACKSCHPKSPAGTAPPELGLSGVLLRRSHERCLDCHADSHAGQLDDPTCESCHTVENWKPSSFDVVRHAETAFPLEGGHASSTCAGCHGPNRRDLPALPGIPVLGKAGVALKDLPVDCVSCHLDPHRGRFSTGGQRPFSTGCRACHGLDSFRPSNVDVELHRDYAYPLEGGHRTTPCFECHEKLGQPAPEIHLLRAKGVERDLTFVASHDRCQPCHVTPHGEQFAERPDGEVCESCHDVRAFRPAFGFDHERDSAFALGPAHEDLRCADCHPSRKGPDGRARVIYRPLARKCADCHVPKSGVSS